MAATQIATRQIQDGAITDVKVAAGAAIATSKLANGADFIRRDGSVAMMGALNLGGQLITNLSTPSASTDATTKSYVDTAIAALNSLFDTKPSAKAATTANITISNPGTATFDTIALSNGDILFVRAQTAPAENGLYTFNGSSSALTRIAQMNAWDEFPGAFFGVESGGSVYGNTLWFCTVAQGGTLGTTAVTFQFINAAGLLNSNFVDKETPSGSLNGSNATFTLANTPVTGTEHVYLNGMLQDVGAGNDYTISGAVITVLTAPLATDKIKVSYRK
jgi:hypothetical protein